ncbi:MAG TPA: hypothetical protein VK963_01045 [Candidatus Saccharimonadales bacterium]|nr:hypothetical protein [Candidatus Saccharimonadales bacterium]
MDFRSSLEVEPFVLRSQLQVDASLRLKKTLKAMALKEGVSLKVVVLRGLATAYPELELLVKAELKDKF